MVTFFLKHSVDVKLVHLVDLFLSVVCTENCIPVMFSVYMLQLLPLPASYPVSPDDGENSDILVC